MTAKTADAAIAAATASPLSHRKNPVEMDRPDKRPFPEASPSENGQDYSEDDDDEEDHDEQSFKDSDRANTATTTRTNATDAASRDPAAPPPAKTRKKPGRKPNPASPAVRKEQNRAAQRAFRDRKERHLQQLENMIKELKESHHHSNIRFQRESHQLKNIIEQLQSENYYLREVVFSFESALGKTGNAALLQDVKAELYRRHYETHAARKLSFSTPQQHPSPVPSSLAPESPVSVAASVPTPAPMSIPMPGPVPVDDNIPHATQVQMLNQALTAAMTAHAAAMTNVLKPSFGGTSQAPLNNMAPSTPSSTAVPPSSTANAWAQLGLADPQDDNIFSMNNDVLYKSTPSLFSSSGSDDGKTATSAPMDPLTAARSNLAAPANWLPNQTYDDLQATLFSQTNVQSNGGNSSTNNHKMPTSSPQAMSSDANLFGQLQDQAAFSPNQNIFTFSASSMDTAFPNRTSSFLDSDDVDSNEFSMSGPSLSFDDGLKSQHAQQQPDVVLPSYRLQMELRILASAAPATDPSIDPKIYAMPHDARIDLIPCPKLRAKMILHQHEYDIEELCQLLLGGAICHGHPLDPHNWELPRAFFDRYGYLMGQELMKYKNKVWPKKTDTQRHGIYKGL
ncbi:hypothetical protein BX616_004058 [Lobosporangium transversale]|uniref:BZIP domain-containing protein n=1 Tax=Lobosporangium transversale TaxID=64571 RepID=A0A1Y2GZI3_9FUNG|nr:hypothetical protein BCR41DRAFT_392134 [Lobosporangium transversale]KAF9898418.1 hypothetical protein BX616_004058 [Lobosporangium transversale]ORZ27676.1 hypothetical protein BCR41DRAFT_392134 [Lobosporangium transversale]|eukprot:XP_021885379.1 hypothetical protein BCR41DRAFT_392134 [Lobosporangium transversale]